MHRRESNGPRLLLFGLIALGMCIGCSSSKQDRPEKKPAREAASKQDQDPPFPPPAVPPRPSEAYIGSLACAECHEEISAAYHGHPMGHSLAKIGEATPLEDYEDDTTFTLPPPPRSKATRSYHVERHGDRVTHHEILRNNEGEIAYDHSVPVHYVVGSGQRGRSYLTNRDGLLFMSPITWYTGSQKWDLSPGYHINNLHFGRRIIDGCVNCHAGRVDHILEAPNRYAADPFIEEAISCERCHGPGAAHVEHWRRGSTAGAHDPIVNPVDLSPAQRDHVCFQCHLVGEHRLTRYGRDEFDFRPGDHIEDIWTVFLKGTGIDGDRTTAAVSQVEQMLSSTCYQQSEGKFGCISCHDPHSLPEPGERIDYYRSQCLNCHGEDMAQCSHPLQKRLEVSSEDSCIECHMPRVAANDVPHTSQTDHRVLRTPDTQSSTEGQSRKNLHIYGASSGRIPAMELDRAQAVYLVKMAEESGNAVYAVDAVPVLETWLSVVPDDLEVREALGHAYWLLKDVRKASETWEHGLKRTPDHEHLLRRLFVLYQETEQPEEAAELGQRLVQVNPWDYEYFGRLAHVLGQVGRFKEAAEAGERALELNPSAYAIHSWLAEVYALQGDTERSAHHRKQLERKSPR